MKIKQKPRFSQCSLCGKEDRKTYREARAGKLAPFCRSCAIDALPERGTEREEKKQAAE